MSYRYPYIAIYPHSHFYSTRVTLSFSLSYTEYKWHPAVGCPWLLLHRPGPGRRSLRSVWSSVSSRPAHHHLSITAHHSALTTHQRGDAAQQGTTQTGYICLSSTLTITPLCKLLCACTVKPVKLATILVSTTF